MQRIVMPLGLATAALAGGLATAGPAAAGGVGDFLSPAFGTSCANQNTGAHTDGATTHGPGAANSTLAGLPLSSALNQCGGADLDPVPLVTQTVRTVAADYQPSFKAAIIHHGFATPS